ncbi:MAG: hypothetical protein NTU66_06025 [Elusimicrobia bacterium]|nr:hypothetical protein [Elusimicrobiota bacterium]
MVTENLAAKKSRYISVKLNGTETYVEDISSDGSMRDYLKMCRDRLSFIREAMPKAEWAIKIEQQWKVKGITYFQMLDAETEELLEEVI